MRNYSEKEKENNRIVRDRLLEKWREEREEDENQLGVY